MEFYFFLQAPGLQPAITLANFPPSGVAASDAPSYACCATLGPGFWRISVVGELTTGEARTFSPSSLKLSEDQAARSLLFLSNTRLETKEATALPRVDGFSSMPNWRANLSIGSSHTRVSYQGEYPADMTRIRGGTVLSIGGLLQKVPGVSNAVFFVNFTESPIDVEHSAVLYDVKGRRTLGEFKVRTNRANFVDLSAVELPAEPGIYAIQATGLVAIPIYFAYDEERRLLSLEHSHPPVELTVHGEQKDRYAIAGDMKRGWSKWLA